MDWLRVAKELTVGQSVRVQHDCNPSGARSLLISHEPTGYRAHCFRCKQPGMWEPKKLSLAERLELAAKQREADQQINRTSPPPGPGLYDWIGWSMPALVWLLKAGFNNADATACGIYYHEASQRVVVPYQGTHHWQMRAVHAWQKPKYIADKNPRQCVVLGDEVGGPIHLTEDLLSAYKIQLSGLRAMPLLGTSLHDEHLALLVRKDARVVVWLDPDKAGQDAAAKIVRRLRMFGLQAHNVLSDRDPKLHSRGEILRLH